ncbi:MAG TPA: metallophosphoesterase family protein [Gemmataceae bacterium]|jgi:diadenosine tetraphosphatase ApaH/serine/threonine PP2A family protein phosphatase|nr:metallophosphoesterase family protein [Gemmataceae bacterium]
MIAVLSDVHANLEALQAVLADLARQGATAVYCLGDVVGYGPDPRACLDLAMSWRAVVLGNHDEAALLGADGFAPAAERAVEWTRGQLDADEPDRGGRERRRDFLAGLPRRHVEGDFLYVHGSARNPLHEYVFPADAVDRHKMGRVFAQVGRYCFQGHTHVPGVFEEHEPGELYLFSGPEALGHRYRLGGAKAVCNVGSVGQPRDGDWRACYALLDGGTVVFRRVEYDVEATVRKVLGSGGLDPRLGERLREGR